jgi:DNA topoisomerase IA
MSKSLIIAEKPSVANDLARALGGFKKVEDHFENEEYIISSAVGHLVELSEQTRGRPYTSPGNGTLDRSVRHLAASHLAGARRQAKAASE